MIQKHELIFLRENLSRLVEHLVDFYKLRQILTIIFHFDDTHTYVFVDDKLQISTKKFCEKDFEIVKKQLLDGGFTVELKNEEDRKELIICS